jgi:phosphoribosylaminoimidazolecarboxamide formyltransferase/IMP cyclohydrolase
MTFSQNRVSIKRALISVSDKNNLEALANNLKEVGVEILSTGGTAVFLRNLGHEVTDVAEYTEFP